MDKAKKLPAEINWHMIGHLQSNKVNQLIRECPNLACVETVDSVKLANALNKASQAFRVSALKVYIEIATSTEDSKSGIQPSDALELAKHIENSCQHLTLSGLMTVPDPAKNIQCFQQASNIKDLICSQLNLPIERITLSIGMSGDWEDAVKFGSNEVRIGSFIFGSR